MYVANLGFRTSSDELRKLFEEFGYVITAKVIMDRESGNSRGFGFVQMESVAEAAVAMNKLNGKQIEGRSLSITLAREKDKLENN